MPFFWLTLIHQSSKEVYAPPVVHFMLAQFTAKPAKVRGAAQACSIVCCDNCKPTKARKAFALTPARCGAGHGAGRGAGCRAPVGGGEAGDARRGRKAGPGAAPQDAACGDAGLR